MKFDRKKFFEGFRDKIDSSIEQEQVDGLNFLLKAMEGDSYWKDVRHIAYALATTGHETAWSFQPVEEGYYLGSSTRVKRFQKTLRYFPFFGRGYVQLTWKKNYEKAGKVFGVNFVNDPDLVMLPANAFVIMTRGMHEGWFTGQKLTDYISGSKCDYKNARRIINGTDKAALIANYATQFEKILKLSAASPSSPDSAILAPHTGAKASIEADQVSENPQAGDPAQALPPSDTPQVVDPPPEPPQAPGQTIIDVPPVVTAEPESIVSKAKGWYAALSGGAITFFGGVVSWVQGASSEIVLGFFGATAIIGTTWIITNYRGKDNDKQREHEAKEKQKERDFQLTKLQMESAMNCQFQTVRVAPPVIEIPEAK